MDDEDYSMPAIIVATPKDKPEWKDNAKSILTIIASILVLVGGLILAFGLWRKFGKKKEKSWKTVIIGIIVTAVGVVVMVLSGKIADGAGKANKIVQGTRNVKKVSGAAATALFPLPMLANKAITAAKKSKVKAKAKKERMEEDDDVNVTPHLPPMSINPPRPLPIQREAFLIRAPPTKKTWLPTVYEYELYEGIALESDSFMLPVGALLPLFLDKLRDTHENAGIIQVTPGVLERMEAGQDLKEASTSILKSPAFILAILATLAITVVALVALAKKSDLLEKGDKLDGVQEDSC